MLRKLKSLISLIGFQEYRDAQKKKKNAEGSRDSQAGVDTSNFTTLIEWLDSATSEAVVGLEHVSLSISLFS